MTTRFISVFLLTVALLSGCGIYRMDIQQGNYITQEQLSQIKAGMSQAQVQDILGTPLLTDDFRQNRWDYIFYQQKNDSLSRQTGVTVFFNPQGLVSNVRLDQAGR